MVTKTPFIGKSYIGSKAIFRIIVSNHDRQPLCWHQHESEELALACPEALAKLNTETTYQFVNLKDLFDILVEQGKI